jgi:amino acid permease
MWMTDFQKIPESWKVLHLASLISIAVCTILLITPAAYHRIVEQGEDSEDLVRVTSRALLWAMVFLALGVAGDFYVVCRVTGIDTAISLVMSLMLLTFFLASWFGYSMWKARQKQAQAADARLEHRSAA